MCILFSACWRTCRRKCHRGRPSGVRTTSVWSVSAGGMCRTASASCTAPSDAALCSTSTSGTTRAPRLAQPTTPSATRCSAATARGWCFWTTMPEVLTASAADWPCVTGAQSHSSALHTHTHTHPFNGPLSGTTRVSRYQKGKTNLDFTEARDIEWQWNRLGHIQVCTSLQTDNHASTPPLSFYMPDALPAGQPTAS